MYVNLFQDIQKLSFHEAQNLFILNSPENYPAADGHYSVAGNRYIGQVIYTRLLGMPDIARQLQEE